MSDVRLTATNPEDSSVVPVACNAKGELKLEEPIAPPEFDGNLDGDLTVSGSASFGGEAFVGSADFYNKFYRSGTHEIFNNTWGPGQGGQNALDLKGSGGSIATIFGDGSVRLFGRGVFGSDLLTLTAVAATATTVDALYFGVNYGTGGLLDLRNASDQIFFVGNDGSGSFAGDVVVGSRSKKWMLVEQGGLCHMVEQARATSADLVDPGFSAREYPKLRDVFQELNTIERCLEEVMTKLRMTEPDGWPVWDGSDNSQ